MACVEALRPGCVATLRAWYAERMSLARGHSTKRRLCLGLAVLSACLGCSARFSATENGSSDSGASAGGSAATSASDAGSSSGGPHEAGTSAGSPAGGAAADGAGGRSAGGRNATGGISGLGGNSGRAGAPSGTGGVPSGAGGAQVGGTSGSLGIAGYGGRRACDLQECFVANTCLDKCGGKVVYTGCCACVPPSVNQLTCPDTD
jgi:hypothetical protein